MSIMNDHDIRATESTGEVLEKWSPLIGIVTAIIGNILISFALNIQRYAHIRLGREQDEERDQLLKRKEKHTHRDYGTQQGNVAEERLRLNLEADTFNSGTTGDDSPSKLVQPRSSTSSLHSRTSSESTLKPSEKELSDPERKTYLRSPYWWAGIILMTVGECGNFLAYGFAPASIVSPLGVVALISNCIIAPCLLKERFRQRDFWGVMVAIGGAVTIVLSAKSEEPKLGQDEILAAIKRWEFETYLGITVALMIVLMWASPRYGTRTILIDLGLVGLFGEYTALSTKGIASLLSDTLWRTLTFPITYILILILVATALMQIRYVNRALQRFDSTQVIPIQFVIFTISVILGSAVLYRDFESATKARIGKFFGGCILTFLGVYLITSGRAQSQGEMGEDGYDEEHEIDLRDEEQYQDEIDGASNQQSRKQSTANARKASSTHIAPDSRRSSKQQDPASPHTPLRTPSQSPSTTSTKSRDFDPSLVANPWRSNDDVATASARPHIKDTSISSPLLPSEATRSNASTPAEPSTPDRTTPLRRTKTRLGPTPLISPLSPSFSAVVADQRRRSLRRPRLSKIRRSKSKAGSQGEGEEVMTSDSPLKAVDSVVSQAVEDERPRGSRSQSISAAVGNFFGRKAKGKSSERRGSRDG